MANTLTFKFHYMFLLIRNIADKAHHVVLFPNGTGEYEVRYPHQLSWSLDGGKTKVMSPLGNFRLLVSDGAGGYQEVMRVTPEAGSVETGLNLLLTMRDVGDAGSNVLACVRPTLLDPSFMADDLGGRVWLPVGGTFTGVTQSTNGSNLLYYDFGTHHQMLTDNLEYTFSVNPNTEYFIEIGPDPAGGPKNDIKSLGLGSGNPTITFTNDDVVGSAPPVNPNSLDDVIEMYRLTQKSPSTRWPVPVVSPGQPGASFRSSDPERPICGGGQGCDPNVDPKCP